MREERRTRTRIRGSRGRGVRRGVNEQTNKQKNRFQRNQLSRLLGARCRVLLIGCSLMWSGQRQETVTGGRGNVTALRLEWRGEGQGGAAGAVEAMCASARQFTGHQRRFPLGQVLGGGDVVPSDLGLLWCSCW